MYVGLHVAVVVHVYPHLLPYHNIGQYTELTFIEIHAERLIAETLYSD